MLWGKYERGFAMKSQVFAVAALVALSACATNTDTGERPVPNSAIGAIGGAVGGYLLGDLVGGRRDRTERIIGAGIGGVAGAAIGDYMDRQERDLRARTADSGVQVIRQGDDLLLTIPSGINFAYKSATVEPRFRPTLDRVAAVLAEYRGTYIDVYGHTDAVGGDAYNQDLSERRAASVAAYLETRGVQRARVGTMGFGKAHPIASNETDEGRAANRRVEIRIVPISRNETG